MPRLLTCGSGLGLRLPFLPPVSDHGAKLYAGFLAWGLRRQVRRNGP
jgi:hypothetical protein